MRDAISASSDGGVYQSCTSLTLKGLRKTSNPIQNDRAKEHVVFLNRVI